MTSSSRLNARRGGGVGNPAGSPKNITSGSRLDAREVVVVAGRRNGCKTPPPARVWTRGRWPWWWWESWWKAEKHNPRLAFGREGGGDGGRWSKKTENTASGSRLDAREAVMVVIVTEGRKTQPPARIWTREGWWWWQVVEKDRKHRLRLAFGREGGGDGGNRDGRPKKHNPRLAFGREGGGSGGRWWQPKFRSY